MVTYVTVASGIEGYNPPEYYRTLTNLNPDILNFVSEISSKALYGMGNIECKNDIFHNMGKCTINYSNKALTYSMGIIFVNDTYYDLIGKVDSWEFVAEGILEITYTIDWYTSVILNFRRNAGAPPTAKTILYRRLTAGEFNYSDEGMKPISTTAKTVKLKGTGEASYFRIMINGVYTDYGTYDGDLFRHSAVGWGQPIYVIYNDSPNNDLIRCIWLGSVTDFGPSLLTSTLASILDAYGSTSTPDPDNLLFVGLIPLAAPIVLRMLARLKLTVADTMLGVYGLTNSVVYPAPIYVYAETEQQSTQYRKCRFEMGDGSVFYDVPMGKAIPNNANNTPTRFSVTPYVSESYVSPTLTLKIENTYWSESSTTITLPIYAIGTIKDAEAIYKATERDYQKAMLSLQSQNELASGVIGGINQGAMISAFSRNQTSTGTDKGIIGGGMAVISAGLNFLYQDLYANKKATEINDLYNRCKPDVLAQDGYINWNLALSNAGLRVYEYDSTTITNITAFQSAFGYQTNKVDTNVALNTFTGYVQADILFDRRQYLTSFYNYAGLIEKYIKNMFNYGVYFTKVV